MIFLKLRSSPPIPSFHVNPIQKTFPILCSVILIIDIYTCMHIYKYVCIHRLKSIYRSNIIIQQKEIIFQPL